MKPLGYLRTLGLTAKSRFLNTYCIDHHVCRGRWHFHRALHTVVVRFITIVGVSRSHQRIGLVYVVTVVARSARVCSDVDICVERRSGSLSRSKLPVLLYGLDMDTKQQPKERNEPFRSTPLTQYSALDGKQRERRQAPSVCDFFAWWLILYLVSIYWDAKPLLHYFIWNNSNNNYG